MIFIETVWKWLIGILLALGLLMVVYLIGKHEGRAGMVSAEEHAAALAALKAAGYHEATVGPVNIPDLPKGATPIAVLHGTALGPKVVKASPVAAVPPPAASAGPPSAPLPGPGDAAGAGEVHAASPAPVWQAGCQAEADLVQVGSVVLGKVRCRGWVDRDGALFVDMPLTDAGDTKLALSPSAASAALPPWRADAVAGLSLGRRPGVLGGYSWTRSGNRMGWLLMAEYDFPMGQERADYRALVLARIRIH